MQDSSDSSSTRSRFNEDIEYSGLSWKKTTLVLGVLFAVGFGANMYIKSGKPEAKTFSPPKNVVSVEAQAVGKTDYPIKITTNGTISAITRSQLVAQVSGEITEVSANFASGGQFTKGEVLLSIDTRNYASAVSSTSANYSQAKANLQQEAAEAEQALKDWQRLGFTGQPNDLVLRKPQLAAAKAQVASAKAAYEKAQLDFSRTQVTAPYTGKVISKAADLGQFVSVGNSLGEIFSNQGLEVQLPLNQDQYAQLNIADQPRVILSANFTGINHRWIGQVVRSDSVFDTTTRQLNVSASITQAVSDNGLELKIGQYVSATIEGRIAKDALVVPNQAIREGSYVYLFENNILRKRAITIVWQDDENSVVEGLSADEQIVTTSLGGAVNGASATLIGDTSRDANAEPANGRPDKTKKKLSNSKHSDPKPSDSTPSSKPSRSNEGEQP